MASKAVDLRQAVRGDTVFAQVGAFLAQHRLRPLPAHYAFAYEVLTNTGGALARIVSDITDGGFRLTERDIVRLASQVGGIAAVAAAATPLPMAADEERDATARAAALEPIEEALRQLERFAATVNSAHADANDFGRDLERSAAAMRATDPGAGLEEVIRLTGAMIERVHEAEARMEHTRRESEELKAALDEARDSARTDPLTELPNRRAFDEAFARLAPDTPVTVAICDIDNFKRVNDTFGHAVGDRVLRAVAKVLGEASHGMVARYGGEEFALLFEGKSAEEAAAEIDALRTRLGGRQLRLRETGQPIGPITYSAGVASGCAAEGRAAVMIRADASLYRAKDLGRARTEIAPPLGADGEIALA